MFDIIEFAMLMQIYENNIVNAIMLHLYFSKSILSRWFSEKLGHK
jgi:hypothetical protein